MTAKEERGTYTKRLLAAGLTWADMRGLHTLANRMQRASELECSVEYFNLCGRWWSSSDEQGATDWVDKGLEKWLKRVNARLEADGRGAFEMETQGDPRGAVVKLRGRGLPCTSWGGEGWFCIMADGLGEGCWEGLQTASDARQAQLKRKAERKAEKEAGRVSSVTGA